MAERWTIAVETQKKHYDKHRLDISFHVGQMIALSTRNFRFRKAEKKLAPTYLRVRITKKIGKSAYEVRLIEIYGYPEVLLRSGPELGCSV